MPHACEFLAYSIDVRRRLLAERAGTPKHVIALKRRLYYFKEYFTDVGASTIAVENGYVDRDYLEDFASYYVRCFQRYERYCAPVQDVGDSKRPEYVLRLVAAMLQLPNVRALLCGLKTTVFRDREPLRAPRRPQAPARQCWIHR